MLNDNRIDGKTGKCGDLTTSLISVRATAQDGDSIGVHGIHSNIDTWNQSLPVQLKCKAACAVRTGALHAEPNLYPTTSVLRAWWEIPDRGICFGAIPFGYLRYLDPPRSLPRGSLFWPHCQIKELHSHIIPDLPRLSSHIDFDLAMALSCFIEVPKCFMHSTASAQRSPTIICVVERVFSPRL